jgi:hypothetical protein
VIHDGEVQLVYCSTEVMIANVLTKEMAQGKFAAFVDAMMLEDTRLEDHEAARSRFEREKNQD